ncbi:50S ribosomal protein L29 [Staphylococcus cohnii]|uniref:YqeB family protein n=1 Tax=Staphylococcus cohnii TaxID=29382 RepID=UPI000E69DCBA|nr:50S ribosomal protein L29 [Staphylococcus cohnii]RIL87995.1 50S ribosomal protein L29 [Staphylococcus cohnii]
MEHNKTILGFSRFEKLMIILIPMILGGTIGWFLPTIAKWILKLPFIPLEKLFIFASHSNNFWFSISAMIIGVIAGIILSIFILSESLKVLISDDAVKLQIGDEQKIINKSDISAVYVEKKTLIILGKYSNELCRESLESKIETTKNAFLYHRYPWKEEDPFIKQYKRWVLGHPDFSNQINALLYAREQALKNDEEDEAKQLRKDLVQLNIVIRDDKNAQYVRYATMKNDY